MTIPEGTKDLLEGLAKVILAIGGVAATVISFIKWAMPWAERLRGTAHGMDQLQVLHDTMKSAFAHGAERVIIFYGHNSGGVPNPGSPFYATAVHWEKIDGYGKQNGKPEESIKDYASLPVDGAYIEMLNVIRQRDCYRFKPNEEKDCLLKSVYHQSGVTDALLVYIGIFRKRIYYMSFARYDGEFDQDELTSLMLKANIIKGIIAKAQR